MTIRSKAAPAIPDDWPSKELSEKLEAVERDRDVSAELWHQLRQILVPAGGDPYLGLFEAAQAVVDKLATAERELERRQALHVGLMKEQEARTEAAERELAEWKRPCEDVEKVIDVGCSGDMHNNLDDLQHYMRMSGRLANFARRISAQLRAAQEECRAKDSPAPAADHERSIRKPGKSKLIYDKTTRSIKTVSTITDPHATQSGPDYSNVCEHATATADPRVTLSEDRIYACMATTPQQGDEIYTDCLLVDKDDFYAIRDQALAAIDLRDQLADANARTVSEAQINTIIMSVCQQGDVWAISRASTVSRQVLALAGVKVTP